MNKIVNIMACCLMAGVVYGADWTDSSMVRDLRAKAESGDVQAQYDLGVMYYKGAASASWSRAAAAGAGGSTARDTDGVASYSNEAKRWFEMAAQQGFGDAQYMLGQMLSEGGDAVSAYAWLYVAKMNGCSQGAALLNSVATQLDATQKAEAEALINRIR